MTGESVLGSRKKTKIFSFPLGRHRLRHPPSLLFNGYWRLVHWEKSCEGLKRTHWFESRNKVKNMWSHLSFPPYALTTCCMGIILLYLFNSPWIVQVLYHILYFYPSTGLDRLLGLHEVEAPRISRQLAHLGGKVVSLTHRLPLPPPPPRRKYSWYLCQLEAESNPGP
jgi:hypothetical protein